MYNIVHFMHLGDLIVVLELFSNHVECSLDFNPFRCEILRMPLPSLIKLTCNKLRCQCRP